MDDRRPNFVTAIFRPISTCIPFSRFDIIPKCPGQTLTNGRTELLYQYRPLQKLLLVLNCRDCRVFESISFSSYAESCFKNIMHLRDRGCVRTLRPLFVYATGWPLKYVEESEAAVLTACVIAGSLSLWLGTDWPWAVTVLDSIEDCESLIWLVCGERLLGILPLLRVRPSDSVN